MNYDYKQTTFSKALLSGLFAGITATCTSLIYEFIYRAITGFNPSAIINVPSIIFASVLILTVAGLIFHFFISYIKKGSVIFKIVFLILTIICAHYSLLIQRLNDPVISKQFEELLTGIVIISGCFTAFFIPYLFNHDKIYS